MVAQKHTNRHIKRRGTFFLCGFFVLFFLSGILLSTARARAATICWTGGTSTAWATGSNWVGGVAPANDATTDIACFNQTSYTNLPTIGNASRSVAGIVIGDGSTATATLTIASGGGTRILTVGASGVDMKANAGAVTISAPVTLGAAQTWQNASSNLLTFSGAVANGGFLLTVGGATNTTISSVVSGTGGITKSGAGTLTLSNTNTYKGLTTLNAGTLSVGAARNYGAAGNDITFGGGTLKITAGFTANSGTIFTTNAASTGTINVDSGQTLTLGTATTNVASTNSTLIKSGSGTLTISAAQTTFDGTLQVDAGTLIIRGSTSVIGDTTNRATLTLNGGTVSIDDSTARAFSANLSVTASSTAVTNRAAAGAGVTHSFNSTSLGAFTLSVNGGANVTSGTAQLTLNALTLTGNGTINTTIPAGGGTTKTSITTVGGNTYNLAIGGTGDTDITGIISTTSGSLTKDDTGTLTLSGANTFTGGLTIHAGTVTGSTSASAFGNSGTGAITLGDTSGSANATLLVSTTGLNYANPVTLATGTSGTLTMGNTGTSISTTFSGGVTGTNNLTVNSNATNGTITFSTADINNTGTVTNIGAGSGTTTVSSNIGSNVTTLTENSSTSALSVTGTATVGAITVTAGTLSVSNSVTVSGATSVTGTFTIASATGTKTFGNVTINNGGTWNNTAANEDVSIGGNLQNDGTINSGTGVYTFTGTSKTFSGANEIAIASVAISGSYTNNGTLTVATALTGSGTLTQGTNSTLNIAASDANFTLTTLTASASGNTVNYNSTGSQTIRAISYYHLTNVVSSVVAFRSKTTNLGTGTNFTATEPTGATQDDVLFMWVTLGNGITNYSPPSGWTELYHLQTGSSPHTYLYWIRRGASAPSYAVSWTGSVYWEYSVTAWSGTETSGNPYSNASSNTPTTVNPNNPDCPSVNTGVDNAVVIAFGMGWSDTAGGWQPPAGYTGREYNTAGKDVTVASKDVASAGSEDPGAFSGGRAVLDWVSEATVSLKPLTTGGPRTLASSGTIGVAGTFTPGASSYTITGSTMDFNGTGAQTIPAFNYNNLTLSGAHTTNSVTFDSSGTVGVAGTFSPTATFTSGAYVVTGSTVDFNGSGSQTIPVFDYNNLTSSSSGARVLASSGTIGVASTFTPGGNSYTVTGSTMNFNGSSAQTVNASFTYNHLQVKPSANSVTTNFAAGTVTVNGDLTVGNGTNTSVVVNANANSTTLTVAGSVSISANTTLQANASNALTVGDDFTNNGTFTHNNGTVVFNDNTKTSSLNYSADTTFYVLSITTSGKAMQFDESQKTIVTNTLTITGADCTTGRIFLDSVTNDNQWDMTVTGATVSISYADVEDANAVTTAVTTSNSTADNDNNTNWTISGGVCGGNANPDVPASLTQKNSSDITISESVWTNSNTPKLGFTITDPDSGNTVKYRVQVATDSGFSSLVLDYTHGSLSASGTTFTFVIGTYTGGTCTGTCPATLSDSSGGYWWRVKAIDNSAAESAFVEPGVAGTVDFKVDATAPTGGSAYDGTSGDQDWNDGSLTSISGNWTGIDATVSGVQKYEYAIRRKPDDYYWSVCSGSGSWQAGALWCDNATSTSFAQNTLNLATGVTYYISVRTTDNAGNVGTAINSNGQQVLPMLSFSLSGNTVAFSNLNAANSYTDTKTITTTTSTNAANGYTIKVYNTDFLRASPSITIPDFSGTWSSPATWSGGQYGFGYTSDDTSVQGSNRFSGGTAFAAFSQSPPGDVVADHTTAVDGSIGSVSSEHFTITYKVAASTSQDALYYQTSSIFIVTANY